MDKRVLEPLVGAWLGAFWVEGRGWGIGLVGVASREDLGSVLELVAGAPECTSQVLPSKVVLD